MRKLARQTRERRKDRCLVAANIPLPGHLPWPTSLPYCFVSRTAWWDDFKDCSRGLRTCLLCSGLLCIFGQCRNTQSANLLISKMEVMIPVWSILHGIVGIKYGNWHEHGEAASKVMLCEAVLELLLLPCSRLLLPEGLVYDLHFVFQGISQLPKEAE